MTTLIVGCGYLGQRLGSTAPRTWRTRVRDGSLADSRRGYRRPGHRAGHRRRARARSLRQLPKTERVFYCVGFDRAAGSSMRAVYVDGLQNVLDRLPRSVTRFVYAELDRRLRPDRRRVGRRNFTDLSAARIGPGLPGGRGSGFVRGRRRSTMVRQRVVLRFAGLYGPGRLVRSRSWSGGSRSPAIPRNSST